MSVGNFWRRSLSDLKAALSAHDPSKLMIAPILFFGAIAVLDRAVYEVRLEIAPGTPERMTRL